MKFKIKVPLTDQEAEQTFQKEMPSVTPVMIQRYGDAFRLASRLTNLPIQVLYSFALIESRGTHNNPSGAVHVTGTERSTGIMQISPNMFYEVYFKENRAGRISDEIKKVVKSYVPIDFDNRKTPMSANNITFNMVATALKDYRFNILASSIVLRRLLEESANNDLTMRLDKAIVKYNVGMYSRPTRTNEYKFGDTTNLLRVVPSITQKYIRNIVGKNGALIYMIQNNIK